MNIAVFDVGGTFIKHCLMIDGKITQAGKICLSAVYLCGWESKI